MTSRGCFSDVSRIQKKGNTVQRTSARTAVADPAVPSRTQADARGSGADGAGIAELR